MNKELQAIKAELIKAFESEFNNYMTTSGMFINDAYLIDIDEEVEKGNHLKVQNPV